MTLSPKLERELRMSARSPGTYPMRFWEALGAKPLWGSNVMSTQAGLLLPAAHKACGWWSGRDVFDHRRHRGHRGHRRHRDGKGMGSRKLSMMNCEIGTGNGGWGAGGLTEGRESRGGRRGKADGGAIMNPAPFGCFTALLPWLPLVGKFKLRLPRIAVRVIAGKAMA